MKSVGEAMAIGRTFSQALQKALRSLEKRGSSFRFPSIKRDPSSLLVAMATPTESRIGQVQQALWFGASPDSVFKATKIDPWFIDQIVLINEIAQWFSDLGAVDSDSLKKAKQHGFLTLSWLKFETLPSRK